MRWRHPVLVGLISENARRTGFCPRNCTADSQRTTPPTAPKPPAGNGGSLALAFHPVC